MWVSRKEFNKLKTQYKDLKGFCERTFLQHARASKVEAHEAKISIARLTKQIRCSCENYEVVDKFVQYVQSYGLSPAWVAIQCTDGRYEKVCLDCGWTTTYDTEEDALTDKQELLDKQIDALKEQKKALK